MLFGLLSLMMGHWIIFVSKICINSSAMSSRFYPCVESGISKQKTVKLLDVPSSNHLNYSVPRQLEVKAPIDFCPEVVVTSYLFSFLSLSAYIFTQIIVCVFEFLWFGADYLHIDFSFLLNSIVVLMFGQKA